MKHKRGCGLWEAEVEVAEKQGTEAEKEEEELLQIKLVNRPATKSPGHVRCYASQSSSVETDT